MPKQVMFSDEGRAALLRGVNIMAAAVKATMGPKGRNVVIDKKFGSPTITKDGVTVAKEIELKDHYENMGAQMVKEVASKTSDMAGDGTTTATVLAHAIVREGLKNVTAGANPMGLKRGIDKAVEAVVEELKKMSKSTKDKKEIAQVATIASNNDKTIGDLWKAEPPTDIVLTTFDVVQNRTRFIKAYKSEYENWPLVQAVMASAAAPTYFPAIQGQFIDGGVGSYNNPCYLAAYEIQYVLPWKPEETTLLSLGTGRIPALVKPGEADRLPAWDWLDPILDAFISSASDQQVRIVETFFKKLDFRRFQVDLQDNLEMDDVSRIPELIEYGTQLGDMILNDRLDRALKVRPSTPAQEAG